MALPKNKQNTALLLLDIKLSPLLHSGQGEQLNNVFTKATGEDSFPSVPESYGRGGVYEYLRRIHDSFDSMQFTYSDSDFYA